MRKLPFSRLVSAFTGRPTPTAVSLQHPAHTIAGARDSSHSHVPGSDATLAVAGDTGAAGGDGGVSGEVVRGHELLRHPCEEGYDYAKGHSACEKDQGSMGWVGLKRGWWMTGRDLEFEFGGPEGRSPVLMSEIRPIVFAIFVSSESRLFVR